MDWYCVYRKVIPSTLYEPAESYCERGFDEEYDCETCPHRYSKEDYECDRADYLYDKYKYSL